MKSIAMMFAVMCPILSQVLSDADVERAIQAGLNKKTNDLISTCAATPGFGENFAAGVAGGIQYTGGYGVTASTHIGRIQTRWRAALRSCPDGLFRSAAGSASA